MTYNLSTIWGDCYEGVKVGDTIHEGGVSYVFVHESEHGFYYWQPISPQILYEEALLKVTWNRDHALKLKVKREAVANE